MELIALLPEAEQKEALAGLDMEQVMWDWKMWGRPEQQAPNGDWNIWIYLAGRGAGKMPEGVE